MSELGPDPAMPDEGLRRQQLRGRDAQPADASIGSPLALAAPLRRRGARVVATLPGPFVLPEPLAWRPGAEALVPSPAVPGTPALFVGRGAASPGRLGELAPLLGAA